MRSRLMFLAGVLQLLMTAPAVAAPAFTLSLTSVDPASATENGIVTVTVIGDFSTDVSATTPVFDLVGAVERSYGTTLTGWSQHPASVTFDLPDECDGVYDLYGEQHEYGGATPFTDTLPGAFTVYPDLAITGLDPETCASDHGDLTLTVHGEGSSAQARCPHCTRPWSGGTAQPCRPP